MDAITLQKSTTTFERDYFEDILKVLENDGIMLLPTDTIWSVGGDATNAVVIERIKKLKQENNADSLIVLVDSIEMLKEYVVTLHPRLETLMMFHARPMTVIYNQAKNLPSNAVAANETIAVRVVKNQFCQRIIRTLGKPIITTSANISEQVIPTIFGEISSEIIKGVDYIAQHRRTDKTPQRPSVIVKYDGKGELVFVRE